MKFSSYAALAGAASIVQANPVVKRAITDADILNYALTLEHLEATFYAEGLQNYSQADFVNAGYSDPFYANLMKVASDEKEHVSFLTSALQAAGAPATAACAYSFPATDVNSFLALANILEGVGVSAYLGAAASIVNKEYLTDAGSILTVEARHSSYLRAVAGEIPFAQPFDNPLDFDEVYTVASPFIVSCPSSNPALPVKAFPSLTATSSDTIMTGSQVSLVTGKSFDASGTVYAAFVTVTGPVWATITPSNGGYSVTVPSGIEGQSYLVLTSSNSKVSDDNILAGPAILEIGAKNGRLNTECTGSNSSTPTSAMPSSPHSIGAGAGAGASSSMPSSPRSTGAEAGAGASSSMPSSPLFHGAGAGAGASSSMPSSPVFTGAAGSVASNSVGVLGAVAAAAVLLA